MPHYNRIVILTGAGISAESGISTFRDKDGLWSKVDYREVATPEGFARNPAARARRSTTCAARPAAAPSPTPRTSRWPGWSASTRAASSSSRRTSMRCTRRPARRNLIHMHGQHRQALCNHCQARHPWGWTRRTSRSTSPAPACGKAGGLRPDVVWFGEMPYHMERIYEALARGRSVHLDRHQRQRLSGRRLRRRGARQRRAHGGAEPRALRRRFAVPPRPTTAQPPRSCRCTWSGCSPAAPS